MDQWSERAPFPLKNRIDEARKECRVCDNGRKPTPLLTCLLVGTVCGRQPVIQSDWIYAQSWFSKWIDGNIPISFVTLLGPSISLANIGHHPSFAMFLYTCTSMQGMYCWRVTSNYEQYLPNNVFLLLFQSNIRPLYCAWLFQSSRKTKFCLYRTTHTQPSDVSF